MREQGNGIVPEIEAVFRTVVVSLSIRGCIPWARKFTPDWATLCARDEDFLGKPHPCVYAAISPICKSIYIGRTGRSADVRWAEHVRKSGDEGTGTARFHRWLKRFGAHNYVLIPICHAEPDQLPAIEEFCIRRWSPALNTFGARSTGSGSRRRRRGRKEREKARKGQRSNQTPVELLNFWISNGKKTCGLVNLLTEQVRVGNVCFSLFSTEGRGWVDKWKTVRRLFGESEVLLDGGIVKLRACKKRIEEGGKLQIWRLKKWTAACRGQKAALVMLLKYPERRSDAANFPLRLLVDLLGAAKEFSKKGTRSMLRRILYGAIKRKTGVNLYSCLVVKVRYDDRVNLSGIPRLCDEKVCQLGLPAYTDDIVKRKSRINWAKNPSVGDMLHNHREQSSRMVAACQCAGIGLPRIGGHVRCRLGDIPGIHPLLANARNVPRSSNRCRVMRLKEEIEEGFRSWKCGRRASVAVELAEVEACINDRRRGKDELPIEEVWKVKRAYEGLVFTPVDKNPGETVVMCPMAYYEGMQSMFVRNTGFEILAETEERYWAQSYEEFIGNGIGNLGKWKSDGKAVRSYILPKQKDLSLYRPICPTFCEPANALSKKMSRALNLAVSYLAGTLGKDLLGKLPDKDHFNLSAVSYLAGTLGKANRAFGRMGMDTGILSASYDVKDMFSRLPHEEIVDAVDWVVGMHQRKGRKLVRVNPRGKGAVFDGPGREKWWSVSLEEIFEFVIFDLEHTFAEFVFWLRLMRVFYE
ncbi:hypothetical protein CBR_g23009 [Chara braunii]|uniref:GIY-YIG domain-containing protein n=1 Tax=Chara braunii TaxID=69332 RepID=A0A388L3B0_CHABU|nr:hypothetical protein CBR_g23009 [Chara braunii]|eukprot:GBG76794.1 hypothetical protein CBR_g23009 [Chara braunii]